MYAGGGGRGKGEGGRGRREANVHTDRNGKDPGEEVANLLQLIFFSIAVLASRCSASLAGHCKFICYVRWQTYMQTGCTFPSLCLPTDKQDVFQGAPVIT